MGRCLCPELCFLLHLAFYPWRTLLHGWGGGASSRVARRRPRGCLEGFRQTASWVPHQETLWTPCPKLANPARPTSRIGWLWYTQGGELGGVSGGAWKVTGQTASWVPPQETLWTPCPRLANPAWPISRTAGYGAPREGAWEYPEHHRPKGRFHLASSWRRMNWPYGSKRQDIFARASRIADAWYPSISSAPDAQSITSLRTLAVSIPLEIMAPILIFPSSCKSSSVGK